MYHFGVVVDLEMPTGMTLKDSGEYPAIKRDGVEGFFDRDLPKVNAARDFPQLVDSCIIKTPSYHGLSHGAQVKERLR